MKNHSICKTAMLSLLVLLLGSVALYAQATITIVNGNAAGVGFNDPTPAAAIGGNTGTTIGAQRLIAFQHAADIWGSKLASNVEIKILATFEPLSCTATAAVLGSAGTLFIFSDFPYADPFPGPEFPQTWYHSALAKKRAGYDFLPYDPSLGYADLRARFNVNLGQTGCLTGAGWYLGIDGNHGDQIDLVAVLLHEFAHGLGFSQFASVSNGSQILDQTDVYGRHILDLASNKTWNQLTNSERAASAINPRKVAWTGANVTGAIPAVLDSGTPLLRVSMPGTIAGAYAVGPASFGAPISSPGVTASVVQAIDPADASGPSTYDACSPLTNARSIAGRIALVDRGTCGFVIKVKNAQNAGAIAVLVADNAAGGPPAGLGGADPTIVIPAARITLVDANIIKAQLASRVLATLGVDHRVRAGADENGRALLYTPNPVQSGSTISHWDTIAFPNQLMEPAINADLTHNVDLPNDLTFALLKDVGWFPDADLDGIADSTDCDAHSDFSPTVSVGGCNSGVPNAFFLNGCTISDYISHIAADSKDHSRFAGSVSHFLSDLIEAGVITADQKGAIKSCADGAAIP
jgi:hypothetical protein